MTGGSCEVSGGASAGLEFSASVAIEFEVSVPVPLCLSVEMQTGSFGMGATLFSITVPLADFAWTTSVSTGRRLQAPSAPPASRAVLQTTCDAGSDCSKCLSQLSSDSPECPSDPSSLPVCSATHQYAASSGTMYCDNWAELGSSDLTASSISEGLALCKEKCGGNSKCDAIYYGRAERKHCGLCASGYTTSVLPSDFVDPYQFYVLESRGAAEGKLCYGDSGCSATAGSGCDRVYRVGSSPDSGQVNAEDESNCWTGGNYRNLVIYKGWIFAVGTDDKLDQFKLNTCGGKTDVSTSRTDYPGNHLNGLAGSMFAKGDYLYANDLDGWVYGRHVTTASGANSNGGWSSGGWHHAGGSKCLVIASAPTSNYNSHMWCIGLDDSLWHYKFQSNGKLITGSHDTCYDWWTRVDWKWGSVYSSLNYPSHALGTGHWGTSTSDLYPIYNHYVGCAHPNDRTRSLYHFTQDTVTTSRQQVVMQSPVKVIEECGMLYSINGDTGVVYRSVGRRWERRQWVKVDDSDRPMADIWGYDCHVYGVGRDKQIHKLFRAGHTPEKANTAAFEDTVSGSGEAEKYLDGSSGWNGDGCNDKANCASGGGWWWFGNIILLDRHTVGCSGAYGLNYFNLKRNTNTDRYNYFRIEATCVKVPNGGSTTYHTTSLQTDGDHKNLAILDRHSIDCGSGKILSKYALTRGGTSNQVQYQYWCVSAPTAGTTTTHHTSYSDEWGGNFLVLDRHKVQCPDGSALRKFFYNRKSVSFGVGGRLSYLCTSLYASCTQSLADPHWGGGSTDCTSSLLDGTVAWNSVSGRHVKPNGVVTISFPMVRTVTKVKIYQYTGYAHHGFKIETLSSSSVWTTKLTITSLSVQGWGIVQNGHDTEFTLNPPVMATAVRFVGTRNTGDFDMFRLEEVTITYG
uniref:F5/8 type C domain-containing protein n=1 Tax=Haptolina ericina TaxID=156174 RepID=A0A7S3AL28_9EUKA